MNVGIALGADGNCWFTEYSGNNVASITPLGIITEYALPTAAAEPYGIALGWDNAMWFTQV